MVNLANMSLCHLDNNLLVNFSWFISSRKLFICYEASRKGTPLRFRNILISRVSRMVEHSCSSLNLLHKI